MSLQMPIPADMREQLADDPFMATCCLASLGCAGRIEWHHSTTYRGKRINELWAILPVCAYHHRIVGKMWEPLHKVLKARIKQFGAEKEIAEKYPKMKV